MNNKILSYFFLVCGAILVFVVVWEISSEFSYDLSYKNYVEKIITKMVKEECLK